MRRRLFTILAALSLVLCLATVVLWVRSYWSADVVRCTTNSFEPSSGAQWSACNINRVVTWGRGELKLEYTRREWTLPPFGLPAQLRDTAGTRLAFAANPPEDPMEWEDTRGRAPWHDFYFNRNSLGSAIVTSETVAAVPIWSLAAFLATLPVVWLVRSVLRRRPFAGQCVQCRYDLRATPGRCPECGAVPHGFRIKGQ